ncbi:MAG: hypothetical protein J5497_01640, partial [Selenomonadaceae bacterium]|nr:hypothetical protein [Selenomonadaceae bacterium]
FMSLYRTVRSFIGRNFVRPFEDYCAVNRPELYEKIFYNFRHTTRREDLGDVFYLQVNGYDDFVQLKREKDFALKVPLNFPFPPVKLKVAAVVHIFYPELAAELKNLLLNIPCAVDVYISTTSPDKKAAIEKTFDDFGKGRVVVKVFANRGRDIAPAFVGFKDIYGGYDVCVHLHSKKSPHAEKRLAGWREHLYRNLLGSPEIVGGILNILAVEKVGVVFPQYYAPIRVSINWGENYLATKNFLRGLGIDIDNRHLIEFPAGSMFWFKPRALAPLLNSGLKFEDFPEECGQVDGTIAHAIERAFLFIVEAAGFTWIKVDGDENLTPTLKSSSQAELNANIEQSQHSLLKRW